MSQSQELPMASAPAPTDFAVEVRPDREIVVLEVSGELCLASAGCLTQSIEEVLGSGFEQLVLDLREVTFMDSTGVRLLLETEARAQAGALRFGIVLKTGQPERVLELVGLRERPPRVSAEELRAR